jgi:hypothetical protein
VHARVRPRGRAVDVHVALRCHPLARDGRLDHSHIASFGRIQHVLMLPASCAIKKKDFRFVGTQVYLWTFDAGLFV